MKKQNSGKKQANHRAGFVAILGRPNAGKSTLLNALLGTKLAIVASKPQTTRSSIQGVLTVENAQIAFVDTPGIHKSTTLLNRRMMESVREAADAPDIALFVIDALAPFTEEDAQAVDLVRKIQAPVIAVLNKIDWLEEKPKILALIEKYREVFDFAAYVPISARKGQGLEVLLKEIVSRLPEGPAMFPEDYLTDQPERHLAAEIIREKVLHQTRQEVPHAAAVVIETWGEPPSTAKRPLVKIAATIFVERPGQKAILIGAGGEQLKKIGTHARQELEHLLDKKVFLQLFVKVEPGWREKPAFLASLDWKSAG